MNKQEFAELADRVITSVRALSISKVMNCSMELTYKGGHHKGICPFHNDKSLGSFVVTESKGIWKCFACGVGGDLIKFHSLFHNINYLDAAFEIAYNNHLITLDEYNYKRRGKKKLIDYMERKYSILDRQKVDNNRANPEDLDKVYNIFINTIREYYKDNNKKNFYEGLLSIEHKKHLKEIRNLTEEEIDAGLFFTFPNRRIMKKFSTKIKEQYGSENILKNIPGFYKEKGNIYYTFATSKGIGFPVRNTEGKITGIQIRLDKKRDVRYIWFSSSFANFDDRYEVGTSAGSPVDISYNKIPKQYSGGINVYITEGKFKTYTLKNLIKTPSIIFSIQGVGSWRDLIKEFSKIANIYMIKSTTIVFDSDILFNNAVYIQSNNLSNELKKIINSRIYYLCWDFDKGKGIDDLLINKNDINSYFNNELKKDNIKLCLKDSWDAKYLFFENKILGENKKYEKLSKVPEEIMKKYMMYDENSFYKQIENEYTKK